MGFGLVRSFVAWLGLHRPLGSYTRKQGTSISPLSIFTGLSLNERKDLIQVNLAYNLKNVSWQETDQLAPYQGLLDELNSGWTYEANTTCSFSVSFTPLFHIMSFSCPVFLSLLSFLFASSFASTHPLSLFSIRTNHKLILKVFFLFQESDKKVASPRQKGTA